MEVEKESPEINFIPTQPIPLTLLNNWNAVKDHNLRSGIPNLEQLLSDKAKSPLTKAGFQAFVETQDSLGTLLLQFLEEVDDFEKSCNQIDLELANHFQTPINLATPELFQTHYASNIDNLTMMAQQLVATYLTPSSPQFIGVPHQFTSSIYNNLQTPGAAWPVLFSQSKQYAFNLLNNHFYTPFIVNSFNTNLSTTGSGICLLFGSLLLCFGLTYALTLVFLDFKPRTLRLIMIPATFVGLLLLLSAHSRFLPPLAFFAKRELSFQELGEVEDQLVIKAHKRKAWIQLAIVLLCTALITMILVLVPGNHLQRSVS